jgi:hypothetical protein
LAPPSVVTQIRPLPPAAQADVADTATTPLRASEPRVEAVQVAPASVVRTTTPLVPSEPTAQAVLESTAAMAFRLAIVPENCATQAPADGLRRILPFSPTDQAVLASKPRTPKRRSDAEFDIGELQLVPSVVCRMLGVLPSVCPTAQATVELTAETAYRSCVTPEGCVLQLVPSVVLRITPPRPTAQAVLESTAATERRVEVTPLDCGLQFTPSSVLTMVPNEPTAQTVVVWGTAEMPCSSNEPIDWELQPADSA